MGNGDLFKAAGLSGDSSETANLATRDEISLCEEIDFTELRVGSLSRRLT